MSTDSFPTSADGMYKRKHMRSNYSDDDAVVINEVSETKLTNSMKENPP